MTNKEIWYDISFHQKYLKMGWLSSMNLYETCDIIFRIEWNDIKKYY